ncbi:MAG: anhydro-N-acetylmuramic acid kinase [Robiginitomaculum sp.]|nr:anhydro-N-acetylmuramic acid kinase [Robiginitomaculum sp.]
MGKTRYKALGLMSGTSLDGVDAAVIETDGERVFGFGATYFRAYTDEEKDILGAATQAALQWNFKGTPPNIFAQAETIIHQAHIEAAQALMTDDKNEDIDLIGFHGQTVLHRPPTGGQNGQTLQLGDGQVLADALDVDVVYDFRTKDVQAGGQGAPLAPVYHQALLEKPQILHAAVLNIGGVSNITIVTPDGELLATDCGPGNGPLDNWVQSCGLGSYDKDGALARAGTPDFALIDKWLGAEFFNKPVPKSADRWDFDVLVDVKNQTSEDGAATLVAFTAMAIANTLAHYQHNQQKIETIIVCGGGRKNPMIMAALREQSIGKIIAAEQIGWRGDDLEAEAFAYLAVRSVKGLSLSYPGTTGVAKPAHGGKTCRVD